MNKTNVKNCVVAAVSVALIVWGFKKIMSIIWKKPEKCTDCYEDVEDEGCWEDPDIEEE